MVLKKSGRTYKGLCPFHSERTPSFHVNPERQTFHCFGCHAGGDVFGFLMQLHGLTFPEAVERLAGEARISLEKSSDGGALQRKRHANSGLYSANQAAAKVFQQALWSGLGRAAQEYLGRRGVRKEMAERFGLGFAPDEWEWLPQELSRNGVADGDAISAGLIGRRTSDGGRYGRFRKRLMFPIEDLQGHPVGFGGRSLDGTEPKYLNSPESPIYRKSGILYGMAAARDAMRHSGRAILVEGYMDLISLVQVGVTNVAAVCGTALTVDHAKLLGRFVSEVVLAYDGDAAGRAATLRGLDILQEAGLQVRVALLPPEHDPDTLVKEQGLDGFQRCLDGALSLGEYKIRAALSGLDLRSTEGKVQGAAKVIPILAAMERAVERAEYLARAAHYLNVPQEALAADLASFQENVGRRASARHSFFGNTYTNTDPGPGRPVLSRARDDKGSIGALSQLPVTLSALQMAERDLLRMLLESPRRMAEAVLVVEAGDFSDPLYARVMLALQRAWADGRACGIEAFPADDQELQATVAKLIGLQAPLPPPDSLLAVALRVKEAAFQRWLLPFSKSLDASTQDPAVLEAHLIRYKQFREEFWAWDRLGRGVLRRA